MTEEQYEELKRLAAGRPISDLVRRALNTEAYLQKYRDAKVMIEKPDGSRVELVRV
jgi:hypothetical protein